MALLVVKQLILASGSPFRRQLLNSAGVKFAVATSAVDEAAITASSPAALALARALAKAQAVGQEWPESLIIGADQVLEFEGKAFDKVVTADAAQQRLRELAGNTHYLHTAYVLWMAAAAGKRPVLRERVLTATMTMRPLSEPEIEAYVATGEWQGSVGCYQFENRGVQLFAGVNTEATTIIGLPLQDLLGELRSLGINPLLASGGPWAICET